MGKGGDDGGGRFALVTAAVLAAAVFTVAPTLTLTLAFGISGSAKHSVLVAGALLGAAAGMWRLVRVLLRFDKQRRLGR